MNQKEFVDILSNELLLSKAEAEKTLKIFFDKIYQTLKFDKEPVYLRSFGIFKLAYRPHKKFRNIHTGKLETLPAHHTITFKPSKPLVKKLNK